MGAGLRTRIRVLKLVQDPFRPAANWAAGSTSTCLPRRALAMQMMETAMEPVRSAALRVQLAPQSKAAWRMAHRKLRVFHGRALLPCRAGTRRGPGQLARNFARLPAVASHCIGRAAGEWHSKALVHDPPKPFAMTPERERLAGFVVCGLGQTGHLARFTAVLS